MEQGLNLATVVLLAILIIGFYVFVIRKRSLDPNPKPDPRIDLKPGPTPTLNAAPLALEPFVVGTGE